VKELLDALLPGGAPAPIAVSPEARAVHAFAIAVFRQIYENPELISDDLGEAMAKDPSGGSVLLRNAAKRAFFRKICDGAQTLHVQFPGVRESAEDAMMFASEQIFEAALEVIEVLEAGPAGQDPAAEARNVGNHVLHAMKTAAVAGSLALVGVGGGWITATIASGGLAALVISTVWCGAAVHGGISCFRDVAISPATAYVEDFDVKIGRLTTHADELAAALRGLAEGDAEVARKVGDFDALVAGLIAKARARRADLRDPDVLRREEERLRRARVEVMGGDAPPPSAPTEVVTPSGVSLRFSVRSPSIYVRPPRFESKALVREARRAPPVGRSPMKFVRIGKMKRVGPVGALDLFTYDGRPVSEIVRATWSDGHSTAKPKDAYLPFEVSEQSLIVAVLLGGAAGGRWKPFAVGYGRVDGVTEGKLALRWVYTAPGRSLDDLLDETKTPPIELPGISVTMDARVYERKSGPDSVRATARDPVWFSPVLTIAGLSVQVSEAQASTFAKAEFMLRVELAGPVQESPALRAFMNPGSSELLDVAETALYDLEQTGRFIVLEPLNFLVEQSYPKPLSLRMEVFAVDRSKLVRVLRGTVIPTQADEVTTQAFAVVGQSSTHKRSAGPTAGVNMRTLLPAIAFGARQGEPAFARIAPYMMAEMLCTRGVSELDFDRLVDICAAADDGLLKWTKHFFHPAPNFFADLSQKILTNIPRAVPVASQLFAMLARCLALSPVLSAGLPGFLERICAIEDEKPRAVLLGAAGEMLYLNKVKSQFLTFAWKLSTADRAIVCSRVCGRLAFVNDLAEVAKARGNIEGCGPFSPYVPVLSLLFRTIADCLTEKVTFGLPEALAELACAAEGSESPELVGGLLFPLFPLFFIFADSIRGLFKAAERDRMNLIVLFLVRSASATQFAEYYRILAEDGRDRFFDFVMALADAGTIAACGGERTIAVREVVTRLCNFMSFIVQADLDDAGLTRVYGALIALTHLEGLGDDAFAAILKTVVYFNSLAERLLFTAETEVVADLMRMAVRNAARPGVAEFIERLFRREENTRTPATRCGLSLDYAACESFMKSGIDALPEAFRPDVLKRLIAATQAPDGACCEQLIEISCANAGFAGLRVMVLEQLVAMYRRGKWNTGAIPAFVAQWHMVALINEVFRIRGVVIPGVPTDRGFAAFRRILDEPKVEPVLDYLALRGEYFTEEFLCGACQTAFQLAREADLYWLVGDVTSILSPYLALKRAFDLLQAFFRDNAKTMADSAKGVRRPQFLRLWLKGEAVISRVGFSEAIACVSGTCSITEGFMPSFMRRLEGRAKHVLGNREPVTGTDFADACQVLRVKADRTEERELAAKRFWIDVEEPQVGTKRWDENAVRRYVFTTATGLPGVREFTAVASREILALRKDEWYLEKLRALSVRLGRDNERVRAAFPRNADWATAVVGLSPMPLVRMCDKIFGPDSREVNGVVKEKPGYARYLCDVLSAGERDAGTPAGILQLVDELRARFVDAAQLVRDVVAFTPVGDDSKELMKTVRRLLRVPWRDGIERPGPPWPTEEPSVPV
jgi:hypothetical protein